MKYQKVIETNKELMPKGEKSGDISYDHQRLEQLDDLRSIKEIAYLFQNPSAQMVMDTVCMKSHLDLKIQECFMNR